MVVAAGAVHIDIMFYRLEGRVDTDMTVVTKNYVLDSPRTRPVG